MVQGSVNRVKTKTEGTRLHEDQPDSMVIGISRAIPGFRVNIATLRPSIPQSTRRQGPEQ